MRELCSMVAELLGTDAVLFLPSGTMCNEIAYRTHTQARDEIILDERCSAPCPVSDAIETNIVYFEVAGTDLTAPQVSERLLEHGVRIGSMDERLMRAVTHLDVDTAGVEEAARALRVVVGSG